MDSASGNAVDELCRVTHKACSKCGRTLPAASFNKANWLPSGLRSDCKECYSTAKKARWAAQPASEKALRKRQNALLMEQNLRQCLKCDEIKPVDDFHKSNERIETACRACVLLRVKDWRARNLDRANVNAAARCAGRYAAKRNRTPPWLSEEHKKQIEAFYAEARRLSIETGVKHHVDHIYPLVGRGGCGLHVPWNLRILTGSENCQKSNKAPDENERPLAWLWGQAGSSPIPAGAGSMGRSNDGGHKPRSQSRHSLGHIAVSAAF